MILSINTIMQFIELLKWSLLKLDDFYVEYNEHFNKNDPKFKVADHVSISKYKNIFAKGYVPIIG